jgi:hypothetical protein
MSVHVVTTLHKDGYNLYGKEFIKTWEQHFPKDWTIDYYAEGHTPGFGNRVRVLDFNETCTEWQDYYKYIQQQVEILKDKKQINRYKKALRWSFKMFTLLHALKTSTSDYVMWLDADVYAKTNPPKDWIQAVLKNYCVAGQIENIKGFTHVETGILPINRVHPDAHKVIEWIEEGYINRKILNEPKPWDGAWIGKMYDLRLVPMNVLWMLERQKEGVPVIAKAFSNNNLNWLVHHVGDKKFNDDYNGRSGRTKESELI